MQSSVLSAGSSTMARTPRVVSVLPSATEALCLIGGEKLLVGRSHEDNFPASITHLPVVTGQKTSFTTARDVDAQALAGQESTQCLCGGAGTYWFTEGVCFVVFCGCQLQRNSLFSIETDELIAKSQNSVKKFVVQNFVKHPRPQVTIPE